MQKLSSGCNLINEDIFRHIYSRYGAPDVGRVTSRRPSLSYQPESQTQQVFSAKYWLHKRNQEMLIMSKPCGIKWITCYFVKQHLLSVDGSNFSRRRRSLSVNRLINWNVPSKSRTIWLWVWFCLIQDCKIIVAGMKMFPTLHLPHLRRAGPADWDRPQGDPLKCDWNL